MAVWYSLPISVPTVISDVEEAFCLNFFETISLALYADTEKVMLKKLELGRIEREVAKISCLRLAYFVFVVVM